MTIEDDTIFVGIDPGRSGGIATMCGNHVVCMKLDTNAVTEADIASFLRNQCHRIVALVEHVGANRKASEGERAQGASGMFSFGQNYGFIRGVLAAHVIARSFVRPQKWQPEFGLSKREGETPTQKKNRHKAKAQELFPGMTVTLWNCDALLLANYCRRHAAELF